MTQTDLYALLRTVVYAGAHAQTGEARDALENASIEVLDAIRAEAKHVQANPDAR